MCCVLQATLHFEGENKLVHIEKGKVDSTITREATDADNIYIVSLVPDYLAYSSICSI